MPVVDFAIVTALLEEFEALRDLLGGFREVNDEDFVWYRARIARSGGGGYEIVAAYQDDMGPLNAQALAHRLIARWDPAAFLLVGIAGSFSSSVKLGDVVASQQVFYYDPGKVADGEIHYRPEGYPCSPVLIRQLEAMRIDPTTYKAWRQSAQTHAKEFAAKLKVPNTATDPEKSKIEEARGHLTEHWPTLHFGTVASGSKVVADDKLKAELLGLHGKILATEMEGAGLLHASYAERDLPIAAIVLKGISDAADKNKTTLDALDHWRVLAAENSARAAHDVIARGKIRPLGTDTFHLEPVLGPLANARKVIKESLSGESSLVSFPRLVVPHGPITELAITADFRDTSGSLNVLKVVGAYRDRDAQPRTLELGIRQKPTLQFDRPIGPDPIGLYVIVDGTVEAIDFNVATPSLTLNETWSHTPKRSSTS